MSSNLQRRHKPLRIYALVGLSPRVLHNLSRVLYLSNIQQCHHCLARLRQRVVIKRQVLCLSQFPYDRVFNVHVLLQCLSHLRTMSLKNRAFVLACLDPIGDFIGNFDLGNHHLGNNEAEYDMNVSNGH